MQDFLTIHELSTQFDVSARVIRYNFHKLRLAGKLAEGTDYVRAHYIDEHHFEWKIAPIPFMRASGLTLAPVEARPLPSAPVSPLATKPGPAVSPFDTHPSAPVIQPATHAAPPVNEPVATVNKEATQVDTTLAASSLAREMIDTLKGQLVVKDGQIAELSTQNRNLNDLNKNLVGQTVKLSERIQELMTLPSGEAEMPVASIKVDEPLPASVNQSDSKNAHSGYPADNTSDAKPVNAASDLGNKPAATILE